MLASFKSMVASAFTASVSKKRGFGKGHRRTARAEICLAAMELGCARIAKPVHAIVNETGSNNRQDERGRGTGNGVDGSWAGRQVPAGCQANIPLRYTG